MFEKMLKKGNEPFATPRLVIFDVESAWKSPLFYFNGDIL